MTNLMNIFPVWVLLSTTVFSQTTASERFSNDNLYCNDTYRFCAEYPASILTFQTPFEKGNGVVLQPKDGFSEVVIAGYPLPPGADPKSIFLSSANGNASTGNGPKIISSIFGEDFYECYFLIDRHYYYHQCFIVDEHFVQVEIKVPINMPDKLQVLQKQISLEFNIQNTVNKATSSLEIGGLRE